jgi:peptide-methionine (R)-S-oxide reductase
MKKILLSLLVILVLLNLNGSEARMPENINKDKNLKQMPDSYWKEKLTPEQYKVARQCGTEPPFTGKYVKHHESGIYTCAACGHELFDSKTKYDSHSGWPSFYDVIAKGHVQTKEDTSHGMHRVEVVCANCGAHLGHVFPDGPNPTGQRYCINSISLDFKKK